MNVRCYPAFPAVIAVCLCLAPVYGQTVEPIPAAAKTATNVAQYRGQIEQFIEAQVEQLQDSNRPSRQSEARDALVTEMALPGQQDPSPAYLDLYANVLNSQLSEQISGHENVRVRLLGAIVAARAAELANNTRLVPVVETIVRDDVWTVSLWGMKASRHLMPRVLRDPLMVQQNRLIGPVVEGAQKHGDQGPIVQEAYSALVADLLESGRRAEAPLIRRVVPGVQTLFAMRIGQYEQRIPDSPLAENRATLFLTEGNVWQAQNQEERERTADLLADHIRLAGQHVGAGRGNRTEMVQVLHGSAGATVVMAGAIGDAALENAADELRQIRPTTPLDDIARMAQDVHDAIRTAFPNANRQDARVADAPQ